MRRSSRSPSVKRTALSLLAALSALAPGPAAAEAWNLLEALGAPDAIEIDFTHRTRIEHHDGQFRAGRTGEDTLFLFRTLVHARYTPFAWLTFGAELQDSRVALDEANSALNTTLVNAAELLQAYAELRHEDVLGGALRLRGGRITLDLGSRRVLARNRFRNTINGHTGAEIEWTQPNGRSLRALWALPVNRLPSNQSDLRDNSIRFDKETSNVQLWATRWREPLPYDVSAELYLLGLHERDSIERPTRNRELYTPGIRFRRAPVVGQIDFELEAILQFGESRPTGGFGFDLTHVAHSHHLEAGYTFDAWATPRLGIEYDYASGDRRATDGQNNRFDPLFGARVFDFGFTSQHGPWARSNINSPAIGLETKPLPDVRTLVRVRSVWLAAKRDAWTTAGVIDPSGGTDRYVGTQLELRLRWKLWNGNVAIDTGLAHLFAGNFIDNAPNSNRQGNTTYLYSQVTLSF